MITGAPLVLRARATPGVGSGHVMRCAVLAEAWLECEAGPVWFWGEATIPFVQPRLSALGIRTASARDVPEGAVLVCDDYDPQVRRDCAEYRAAALRVLVDDLGEGVPAGFEAVWNPNAYGTAAMYAAFPGAVLAGPDVVPVRRDLPRWTGGDPHCTAVLLGGGRPPEYLARTLVGMAEGRGSVCFAGAGTWVPRDWPRLPDGDPWPAVAALGRLITTSGTTVWEAAAVGVPVVVVRVASNQDLVFQWALESGVPGVDALNLGADLSALSAALDDAMARARPLPAIVNGASRVRDRLQSLVQAARCA